MSNREVIEWLRKKAETMPMPGARKMYEAAAKALEAQKYMISRQAVLDALNNIEIPRNASWYQYYQQALTAVEKLPPAPTTEVATDNNVGTKVSTNLAEVGTDAISRLAVIQIIEKMRARIGHNLERSVGGAMIEILDEVGKDVEKLPSAEPERTCVNCGRAANNGGWYADGRTRCPIEEHYALPKDGYCHLWEKRNVTDDDYPERREE